MTNGPMYSSINHEMRTMRSPPLKIKEELNCQQKWGKQRIASLFEISSNSQGKLTDQHHQQQAKKFQSKLNEETD